MLAAYTAGVAAVQTLATLPGRSVTGLALAGAVVCVVAAWRRPPRWPGFLGWILCVLAAVLAGSGYASIRAHVRLADSLACVHRDRVQRLEVVIAGLTTGDAQRRRVVVEVSADRPAGVPRHIVVTWYAPFRSKTALPELVPGQRWRMALLLRPPRGLTNPTGFDAEAGMFAQNVRATGRVRGKPILLAEQTAGRPDIWIQRLRYTLRQRMLAHLEGFQYASLVVALALGDQSGITPLDRQILNRSGIAHLVAISGLHIGWVAGLVAGLMAWFYRRLMWPARWTRRHAAYAASTHVPAQTVGAIAAWIAAAAYCSLAGWGIPARRVFIMLTVFLGAILCRLPCGGWRALAVAAALVVTADPWAPLSAGFWLSFAAVAVILALVESTHTAKPLPRSMQQMRGARSHLSGPPIDEADRCIPYRDHPEFLYVDPPPTRAERWRQAMVARFAVMRAALAQAGRIQWVLTLALAPFLAFGMGNVSLVSPLANAFAIPLMGAVGTPLTLAFAVACLLAPHSEVTAWLGTSAHRVLAATMAFVSELTQWKHASWPVAAAPTGLIWLAMAGTLYALLPRGLPFRRLSWSLLLPLLLARPGAMRAGEWRLVALDIGQGGAIVVLTAKHAVVFDTGLIFGDDSDSGERVIAPYLMSMGRRQVDRLIVSHRHADHDGGVAGLRAALPVGIAHAPYDLNEAAPHNVAAVVPVALQACAAGVNWVYEGVRFSFLHPPAGQTYTQTQANASSCVLRIDGAYHSAVLTGDMGKREEHALADVVGQTHVVLAAHHGSASSSSQAWVNAVGAWHAISQNGYRNRFNHPAPIVERRWRRAGVAFWRNDLDGAVEANSTTTGLRVFGWRDRRKRYWHEPLTLAAEETCSAGRDWLGKFKSTLPKRP